jgi:GNAT superfamily N-acetyltransferase
MLLREVRLDALADTPLAFESTFEAEASRAEEEWEADAASRSAGFAAVNFLAEAEAGVVGLVGAYRSKAEPGTVELVSMWVAPAARGQGVGERLVERVVEWAAAAGATHVALWVTKGNDAATALYTKTGFAPALVTKAHWSHPCGEELRMARELSGAHGE